MSAPGPTVRSIDIWPHRSLDARGGATLLAVLAVLLALGVLRAPAGTRGVIQMGSLLTLAIMAVALWLNARAARISERVEIGPQTVRVLRIDQRGAMPAAEFHTHWVRVVVRQDRRADTRVLLEESGRRASVGGFLAPAEREELARAIRAAIAEARCGVAAAPVLAVTTPG